MLGFLKARRDKRERQAALRELGETLAADFNAQVALFIEMSVVPVRKAFLESCQGQLAQLDERMKDAEVEGELTREEAAALDVRIMMDHWDGRATELLDAARQWLAEEYDLAEAAGIAAEFHASVEDAINGQRMILLTDGMAEINRIGAEDGAA
jgi:hypothetical protein